jgi:DNA topoisomerase VI subunit B
MALLFYNNVKEMSRRGDPAAAELNKELKTYFKRKKSSSEEPTMKAQMRDAIIHGKKDGRIIIENESPKLTGGVHKVIDDVRKGKAAFKETDEGEIRE